jgi:pilus assembly protein Flp/PilA
MTYGTDPNVEPTSPAAAQPLCRLKAAMLENFYRDETGATSIEYALIAGIVSLAIIAGASTLGTLLKGMYEVFGNEVAAANTL